MTSLKVKFTFFTVTEWSAYLFVASGAESKVGSVEDTGMFSPVRATFPFVGRTLFTVLTSPAERRDHTEPS